MNDYSKKDEEKQEQARKVVRSGFEAMMDKSRIAEKIIELDDSYDKLELMKHVNYTTEELKELLGQLKK